jgi:LysR substrate binding domain
VEPVEVDMPVALQSVSFDVVYRAALDGVGVAMLSRLLVARQLETGALVHLLPGWVFGRFTIRAALPTRKLVPARARALLDFLAESVTGGGERRLWRGFQAKLASSPRGMGIVSYQKYSNCVEGRIVTGRLSLIRLEGSAMAVGSVDWPVDLAALHGAQPSCFADFREIEKLVPLNHAQTEEERRPAD